MYKRQSVGGIRAAVICNAVISFVLTILAFFVLESPSRKAVREKLAAESKEKSNFFKDFGSIAKQPATWLVAISIFAVYSFMSTLT